MGYFLWKIRVFFMKEITNMEYVKKHCTYRGSTEKYSIYYDWVNKRWLKVPLTDMKERY
jgi:hypothetical protein